MWKTKRIIIGSLLAGLLGALVWFVAGSLREPSYHGKRLSVYLDQVATNWPQSFKDGAEMEAIYRMGPKTIPYLRRGLRVKQSLRERTLTFLQSHLPKTVAARFLQPKNQIYIMGLNSACAHALADFGPLAREALPDLIDGFKEPFSANMAVYAIQEIGLQPENIPALLPYLTSTNRGASLYAAQCLGQIGEASPEVLAGLSKAAESSDSHLCQTAIQALGALGLKARATEALVVRQLDSPDIGIRLAAARALWSIQGKTNTSVAWLTTQLSDELKNASPSQTSNGPSAFDNSDIHLFSLASMLGEFGTNASPAVPLLRQVVLRPKPMIQMIAARAIFGATGEANLFVSTCVEALTNKDDPGIRHFAAQVLAKFCAESRILPPGFEKMMTAGADGTVRFYAARATWQVTSNAEKTLPHIQTALQDHVTYYYNQRVRAEAATTLGEMGTAAKVAAPDLFEALKDPNPEVRKEAAKALRLIDPAAAAKAGVGK